VGGRAGAENDGAGATLKLGPLRARVLKSIVRCAATHVNPQTAARDADVTRALFDNYGHMLCGLYLNVLVAGRLALGDACAGPEPS
jgi:uncharacterized protein YcbX